MDTSIKDVFNNTEGFMILKNRIMMAIFAFLMGAKAFASDFDEKTGMLDATVIDLRGTAKVQQPVIAHRSRNDDSDVCRRVGGYIFILVKTAADVATLYYTIQQIYDLERHGSVLASNTCVPLNSLCNANLENQGQLTYDAYMIDAATAGLSAVACVIDVASLVAYACDSNERFTGCSGKVFAASGVMSLLSMLGAYGANGCLWYAKENLQAAVSPQVVASLNKVVQKGIPVVVLDSIAGILGIVAIALACS